MSDIPPILEIDAIWITQLRPTVNTAAPFGRARGRLRAVKGRFKRPVFLAMGVWPEEGRRALLRPWAWQLGESESAVKWVDFLAELEAHGIRGDAEGVGCA